MRGGSPSGTQRNEDLSQVERTVTPSFLKRVLWTRGKVETVDRHNGTPCKGLKRLGIKGVHILRIWSHLGSCTTCLLTYGITGESPSVPGIYSGTDTRVCPPIFSGTSTVGNDEGLHGTRTQGRSGETNIERSR